MLLTNHHCGYGAIQDGPTVENDYLTDGFCGHGPILKGFENPDLFVDFLIRMEDVTERVLAVVNDEMTEAERAQAIDAEMSAIKTEATEDNSYICKVKSFYEGNEFYMFMYGAFLAIFVWWVLLHLR